MTDDHVFVNSMVGVKIDNNSFTVVKCKYCNYEALKGKTPEYVPLYTYYKVCLTGAEKVIKDLLE
jgi:hypothetical protein